MGIRRRRKKLTSLISNLDRDIRSTTLRQVKRQTASAASDVTEEDETTTVTPPPAGTEIAIDPPDQWAKVIGGYYYPPTRTGGLGQVELFLDEDLQLSSSDKIYVSGTEVKWNQNSGGKNYTGSFRPNTSSYESTTTIRVVSQYGNPSWSTRAASTKPTYASIPSGVTNSILYTVTNKDYIPSRVTLSFRGQVASYYATTTTATITFTAAHHFVVGHILDVSSLGAPMSDVDGIIKVTAIPSNTQISYEFTKPLASAVTTTTPSTTSYVNAVVSKYTTIGSSWIDSSVTPNKVYIWDGLRWVGYTDALADGLVTDDMVAPAPPTDLSLTSVGYIEEGVLGKVSKSSVSLSWTAPTTNAEGDALNDLAGYRIWYSTTSATGPWIGKENFGQETSQTIVGLTPELTYYFRVIAFDTTGRDSTGVTDSIVTLKTAISVQKPSAPTTVVRLGTVKVLWDGKDYENADTPFNLLAYVEVHYSTSTGFTPDETTLLGKIYGGPGYIITTELTYNTDYYFKLIAVDINKRSTASSAQATAKIIPLVDADLIAANLNSPLSVWPFAPKAVTAGALADGALDASSVFGPGVIVQSAIAANAIGANQIAANAITAGKIEAGAVTAAKIEALAISADKLAANAVTADKIDAGAVTAVKIDAGAVTAAKILATDTFSYRNSANTQEVRIGGNALGDGNLTASTAFYLNSSYYGSVEAYYYGASGNYGMRYRSAFGGLSFIPSSSWGPDTAIIDSGDIWHQADVELILQSQSYARFVSSPKVSFEQTPLHIFGDGAKNMIIVWNDGNPYDSGSPSARLFYVGGTSQETVVNNSTFATTFNSFYVYGKIRATGTITGSSSRRWKTNISPVSADYRLLDIPTVTYQFDRHSMDPSIPEGELGELQIGMIAEDFIDAGLDLVVGYDNDGNVDGLDYSRIVTYLIPIVKELKQEIDSLKAKLGA